MLKNKGWGLGQVSVQRNKGWGGEGFYSEVFVILRQGSLLGLLQETKHLLLLLIGTRYVMNSVSDPYSLNPYPSYFLPLS